MRMIIDSGTKIHDARFAVQLLPFNSGLVGGANFWPWFFRTSIFQEMRGEER